MTESRYLDPEDEAFNEIERQAKQRMEAVKATMEKHMDSEPTFPKTSFFEIVTLRDYFAAKAMQKLMGTADIDDCCQTAYRWADAMLKAREV